MFFFLLFFVNIPSLNAEHEEFEAKVEPELEVLRPRPVVQHSVHKRHDRGLQQNSGSLSFSSAQVNNKHDCGPQQNSGSLSFSSAHCLQ